MTYAEVLEAIHHRKLFSSTASLDRITRLMHDLGDPQDQIRTIHVAGTNGKGSVCALVESALRADGYRVGLFTSPYLVDFRERFQINRQRISKRRLTACYRRVMAAESKLEADGFEPVNEFELVTAIGFTAFAAERVDFAVIEVGLGGRCDATNVISRPEVCCITSISRDHTAILGNTLTEIAAEKAGIIKPDCPTVVAPQSEEARSVILAQAKRTGSPVVSVRPWQITDYSVSGMTVVQDRWELSLPLLGRYQADNAGAAWEVCRQLDLPLEAIQNGFAAVSWPGRLQYIPGAPDMLIDAGHNQAGIDALLEALDDLFPQRRVIGVVAMMRDKDHKICVPKLAARCSYFIAATVNLPRSLPPEELAAEACDDCLAEASGTVTQAIRRAKKLAQPGDLILVCGSVYAAGEAQRSI